MLATSGLPAYAVTPLFVEQLAAADDDVRERMLAERRELIARAAAPRPMSAVRRDGIDAEATPAFIAAIRGRRAGSVRPR